MSDQFWLCEEQLKRINPYFPLSHGGAQRGRGAIRYWLEGEGGGCGGR
jgi:hypothetical protein